MLALKIKTSQLERKNRALRHRSIIHRVIQVTPTQALALALALA